MPKVVEKKKLKKGVAQFMLIGEAKITDYTFKKDQQSNTSDWVYNMLNLGVDCGSNGVVYCDLMGGYGADRKNIIYVHGKKQNEAGKLVDDYGSRFTIDWESRFDEDLLETIGDSCFITIGVEKDASGKVVTQKFLSAYDAINYLEENLKDGTLVNVKGNLKYQTYQGNTTVKKEITSVYLSKVEDRSKHNATFRQTILLNQDSLGALDKEKAIFPIQARVLDYTKMYNDKEVKAIIPFVLNYEFEVNKKNPELTKSFLHKYLKVKKDVRELIVDGEFKEGEMLVEVTEKDIPEDLLELIEQEILTKEEVLGKLVSGGVKKEKKMVIRKPVMVTSQNGDINDVKISLTDQAYTEEDLILDFMIEKDEDEVELNDSSNDDSDDDDNDADDNAWLDALKEF
jgi:hypothetical protein